MKQNAFSISGVQPESGPDQAEGTRAGQGLGSPDSRRPPAGSRSAEDSPGLTGRAKSRAPGPADRTRRVPDATEMPRLDRPKPAKTFTDHLARAARARAGRLRSLWQMTPAERVAAMRRGELTVEQLAAWSAKHAEQVPLVNGEFEWIAARTPEACE
jgi:hypothetical protein